MKKIAKKCIVALLTVTLAGTGVTSSGMVSNAQENTDEKQIKNIIYMIPDGGGFPSYQLTKAVKEAGGLTFAYNDSNFNGTKVTESNKKMYLEDYLTGSVSTRSNNNETTDSAAAGTALATGTKTNNSYMGVNPNYKPVANILELAQLEGKSTGIIATSYEYDATPAAFASHTNNRENYSEIIEQMKYSDINLVLGGGINYSGYTGGNKSDGVKEAGYTLVGTESQLENIAKNATKDTKIWGTFQSYSHHMPYDFKYGSNYDGIDDSFKNTPTLAEMTESAIEILSKNEDGFFLMVEGSKVDYGCHHGKTVEIASEYIAFDEAFKIALEYAKNRTDTVVISVADHNTGLNSVPEGSKLASVVSTTQSGNNYEDLDWAGGTGSEYPHTSADVGLFMYLPEGVEGIDGTSARKVSVEDAGNYKIDNAEIAPYLASLISDTTLKEATNQLYVDVTNLGSCNNGTFKFNEKDASVKINTDQAIINQSSVDLEGEVALYVNGKVYAPKKLLDILELQVNYVDEKEIQGSGTKEDPYIIANKENFLKFTNNMISGETYEGKYVKQTANIDMSNVAGYMGIGSNGTFAGIYDGQGHTIAVNINASVKEGIAPFPYTSGTIMNLGTIGAITNTYPSEGGCAGIARSVRETGAIVNCYSTVDLSATKDAGGIAWTLKESSGKKGIIQNCYYKGKIEAKNNYGIAWNEAGTVSNAYYQLEEGSTSLAATNISGTKQTSFEADILNSYQQDAVNKVSAITSAEQLCKFADVDGYDFAFQGSLAKLIKFSYTYTGTNGETITQDVENFQPDVTGYNISISGNIDSSKPITLTGTALNTNGNEMVTNYEVHVNEYGFATGEVRITTKVANNYYTTEETLSYGINITAPVNRVTVIPTVTVTPVPSITITPTVTAVPSVTSAPTATAVPTVTSVPTATAVPTVTTAPSVSATPSTTPAPSVSAAPSTTPDPSVTVEPSITVEPSTAPDPSPSVTATPIATEIPEITVLPMVAPVSIKNVTCAKIGDKAYTGKNIKPAVQLKYKGTTLKAGKDYKLTYKNNKNIGKATIIISGIGSYKDQKTVTFKIVPKKPTFTSAKYQNNEVTLKWKKVKGATGYEIYRSTKKNSGYKKIGTIKKGSKVTYIDKKKLKQNKKYYYKIRAVKKNYKSSYSKVKSVKVKKAAAGK